MMLVFDLVNIMKFWILTVIYKQQYTWCFFFFFLTCPHKMKDSN